MSSLEVLLPSILVPVVVVCAVGALVWCWCRAQRTPRKQIAGTSVKVDKSVQCGVEPFSPKLNGDHRLEEGLAGKSVVLAAEVGFNDQVGDRWFKSHDVGNDGWDQSILLGKENGNGFHHVAPKPANGDHKLAMLESNLEVGTPIQENSVYNEEQDTEHFSGSHESISPDNHSNGHSHYYTMVESAAFVHDIPSAMSIGDIPMFLNPNVPADQSMLFNTYLVNSAEGLDMDGFRLAPCQRLHPDTMEPMADGQDFGTKGSVQNLVWLQEESILRSRGADSSFESEGDPATPRQRSGNLLLPANGYKTPTEASQWGYGTSRSKTRSGSRRNGYTPRVPNRDHIIRLHKQMFAEKHEAGNLCSPVELPGDNGISFYRGASSLMGVMLSAAADEAPINVARKGNNDDDEMWG